MRINLYSQELTEEVQLVETVAENTGKTFYGLRFFLVSPETLHAPPRDDDRSAVTFWMDEDFTPEQLYDLLTVSKATLRPVIFPAPPA